MTEGLYEMHDKETDLYVHYHLVVIRWDYILQSKDVSLFGGKYKASSCSACRLLPIPSN
jgi:hypothetical protein